MTFVMHNSWTYRLKLNIKFNQMNNRIQHSIAISFFLIFAIYLIAQHRLVFPYHDDWGFAVLDYVGEQTGFLGQNFKLKNLFYFLSGMYQNWSGRVFAFFIQITLFKMGLEYVRLFQVLVILAIIYFSAKINSERCFGQPLLVTVPILLYLSLPIFSVAGGLYWFSSASAYVWGIPLFLLAAYIIKNKRILSISSSVILACSAVFHEQMAIAAVVFILFYIALTQLPKHINKTEFLLALPVFFTAAFTIFAPGNFNRKSVSAYAASNLYEIIWINANSLLDLLVKNTTGKLFSFFILVSFVIFSAKCFVLLKNKTHGWMFSGFSLLAFVAFYFISPPVFLFFGFLYYGIFLFILRNEYEFGTIIFSIYAAAVSSLTVLLIAPGVPGRALLTFYFLMFIPIVFSFVLVQSQKYKFIVMILLLVILPFAIFNAANIYVGYKSNYQENFINDCKLSVASYELQRGHFTDETISLYKLPNSTFAETMPYQRPLIEKWMKKYYSLPADLTFVWQ